MPNDTKLTAAKGAAPWPSTDSKRTARHKAAEPTITPAVLTWALDEAKRNGKNRDELLDKHPGLESWEAGSDWPTYTELKKFASATNIPYSYLLRTSPPKLKDNPISDFRTLKNKQMKRVSWNLRETIYIVKRRQNWLRDYLADHKFEELNFVGSITLGDDPQETAIRIRATMELVDGWASQYKTFPKAFNHFKSKIEELGIAVMVSGIVGNNTRRGLNKDEFRGFSLPDNLAPMIFVNGTDHERARIFTLAHELVHIWLNQGGTCLDVLDNIKTGSDDHHKVEQFCNQVAAEILVPEHEFIDAWNDSYDHIHNFKVLSIQFRVSQYVIAIRAQHFGLITKKALDDFKNSYEPRNNQKKGGGGDSKYLQNSRLGHHFATHIIYAAKDGKVGYADACELVGLSGKAFQNYAKTMGIEL